MRASESRLDSSDRFLRPLPAARWRPSGAFALWALAGLAYCGWEFWLRWQGAVTGTTSSTTLAGHAHPTSHASMFVALALASAGLAWIAWRLRPTRSSAAEWRGALLVDWLCTFFSGAVIAYFAIALLATRGDEAMLLMIATAGWGAAISLPLAADMGPAEKGSAGWSRRWLDRRGPRRAGALLFILCVAAAGIEAGLRLCGAVWGPDFYLPRPQFEVTYSPSRAPVNDRSRLFAPQALRVAVLGDALTTGIQTRMPSGGAARKDDAGEFDSPLAVSDSHDGSSRDHISRDVESDGFLAPVEFALPGLDIVHVAAPGARLKDYVREGLPRACAEKPRLLLVFISVADDLVDDAPRSGAFGGAGLTSARIVAQWTGWKFGQPGGADRRPEAFASHRPERSLTRVSFTRSSGAVSPASAAASPSEDRTTSLAQAHRWEDYVRACGPQLIACRKKSDPAMQARWKSIFAQLDAFASKCEAADIPLALVVTPSPVQTNAALLEAVCRRQGCTKQELDLELPQRRLAVYAAQRNLPALDLLPPLKQSSEQPFVHQSRAWTEAGRATVARTLDSWLRSTFATMLLPERAPVAAAWNPADDDRLVAH